MPRKQTWNDRLNWALKDRGVSKAELARACRIQRASITDWSSGKTKDPKIEPFFRACRRLNLRPAWLGLGEDPITPTLDDLAPADRELFEHLRQLPPETYSLIRKLIDLLSNNDPMRLTAKEIKLLQQTVLPKKSNSSSPRGSR